MISRYERAKSSPISRIDKLAKALDMTELELLYDSYDVSRLMDNSHNRVPYFTSAPKNNNFTEMAPDAIYSAPQWVVDQYDKVVAVDPAIFQKLPDVISTTGPLYIALGVTGKPESFCMGIKKGRLVIEKAKLLDKTIGTLIAQERRFLN